MHDGYRQLPIQRHGVTGDRRTAALIAADGSIPWLCLPNYDGAPLFGALLDEAHGGYWRIAPVGAGLGRQSYAEDTATLVTTWGSDDATLSLADAMAWPDGQRHETHDGRRIAIRRLSCNRGTAEVRMDLFPRWDFVAPASIRQVHGGAMIAAAAHRIGVWSNVPLTCDADSVSAGMRLTEGEEAWFALGIGLDPGAWTLDDAATALAETERYWQRWLAGIHYTGPRRHFVRRSALTFHLLSFAASGAVVAAPTASLPEKIGGSRNYDYRFAWIRDASLSLAVLSMLGHTATARAYMDWLAELPPGPHMPLQVLYRIDGSTEAPQRPREELTGYRASTPVLFGNHAAGQNQIDSLGYLAECALIYLQQGGEWCPEYWSLLCRLADHVVGHWRDPGHGIWELSSPALYTSSAVMSWVVLDRAIRVAEKVGEHEHASWRECAERIRKDVLANGWSEKLGAFRQRYDADSLDASVLLIAVMDMLPADDPRVIATAERIEERLAVDGWVFRFDDDPSGPGPIENLPDYEGAFLPCTFWLATTWAKAGFPDRADAILDRTERTASSLGLFPEEVEPRDGTFLGNMPLLFSHAEYLRAVTETGKATLSGRLRMMPGEAAKLIHRITG